MLKCEVEILDLAREEPDRIAFVENSERPTYAGLESQNLDSAGALSSANLQSILNTRLSRAAQDMATCRP